MKKIPTLYKRDPENMKRLLDEVHPDCQWVLDGQGIARVKVDGTSCRVAEGQLLKRREVKKGKPVPEGFIEEQFDPVTGKRFGWMPVEESDKFHLEARANYLQTLADGTYELLGPKIQGNAEGFVQHTLVRHDQCAEIELDDLTLQGLEQWAQDNPDIEGIVWHHEDGRMAKIKRRDFGLAWPVKAENDDD